MSSADNPYGVQPTTSDQNQENVQSDSEQVAIVYKNNTLAITSLILGILSIFLAIFTALPGVITGHMALSKIKKAPNDYEGKGMAIAGLILSYIFLILTVVFVGAMIYMAYEIPGFKDALTEGFNEGLQQGMQPGSAN